MTVQDLGRPGFLAFGLSRGGAADQLAVYEGAALLDQSVDLSVIELAGMGGEFGALGSMRIALTGAPMPTSVNGRAVAWNASHRLCDRDRISIGGAEAGAYGYLHVGGGFDVPSLLRSRSCHLAACLGSPLKGGDQIELGPDHAGHTGLLLDPTPRFHGGSVRVVASLQTDHFSPSDIQKFQSIRFRRSQRGNRMGVRLDCEGISFRTESGLSILSETIVPGDIQITGDGAPFVLLAECQTNGGYPRIATVIPSDLPKVAQLSPDAEVTFEFVSIEEAISFERHEAKRRASLRDAKRYMVRDPHTIPDLLAYQIVSGVTAGDELEDKGT